MRHALPFLLACLALLPGCERQPGTQPAQAAAHTPWQALPAETVGLRQRGTACGDRCPEFRADWLSFPQAPALDAELLRLIDAPSHPAPRQDVAGALRQMAAELLAEAASYREPWQQMLVLRQREGRGRLVVLDFSNYLYTGGAHGTTTVGYVLWDRQAGRIIRLRDLLRPGQAPAFWQAARQAHARWLQQQSDAASLQSGWPFEQTDNIALLPDALVLKYQPYSIGPYAMGTPELRIPLAELAGILKPEWLSER